MCGVDVAAPNQVRGGGGGGRQLAELFKTMEAQLTPKEWQTVHASQTDKEKEALFRCCLHPSLPAPRPVPPLFLHAPCPLLLTLNTRVTECPGYSKEKRGRGRVRVRGRARSRGGVVEVWRIG